MSILYNVFHCSQGLKSHRYSRSGKKWSTFASLGSPLIVSSFSEHSLIRNFVDELAKTKRLFAMPPS